MTSAPFTPSGEPTTAFVALLLLGRERGYLAPDDLMGVLEGVELRPELISAVVGRVVAEGIEWREAGSLLSDEGLDRLVSEVTAGPGEPVSVAARSSPPPRHSFLHKRQRGPVRSGRQVTVAGLTLDIGVTGGGASDSVRAYLKEIGRLPLLTGDQEVALARCIATGKEAAARLDQRRPVSRGGLSGGRGANGHRAGEGWEASRQREADERLRAEGSLARQVLIEANLRLVVSVAKWYRNRGLSFLDMVQEGNIGLMRAVERFDHTKGFKFSTYATWWIRQAISRAISDQARTIRIPVHMIDNINAVIQAQRNLLQDQGREPTVDEVARQAELTPERARVILRISQDTISLDQPLGEDDFSLCDTLEDEDAVSPGEAAVRAMLADALGCALADLTERERAVVRMRFGLDDGRARTLEEVGKRFGVTRERVRQIESTSLAKLREPLLSAPLRDYLDD